MLVNENFYCQLPVNCTDEPSPSLMEPETWNPGMDTLFPVEGAHETFTRPPDGRVLGLGEKTPEDPFMVQLVAWVVPPEFTNEITHSP